MFIPRILIFFHPGFRIQQQQKRGEGKEFVALSSFVAINFTKLKIILISSLLMPSSRAITWATCNNKLVQAKENQKDIPLYRDVYPGSSFFLPSRISDPTTAKQRREEKLVVLTFCSYKFHKIENYLDQLHADAQLAGHHLGHHLGHLKTSPVLAKGNRKDIPEPGCLSRILVFRPSRIPDSASRIQQQQKRGGGKEFVALPFL
jgi:hypothetical protein